MSLKRRLACEIRTLLTSPLKIIIPCAVALLLGICTWFSCRELFVIWRLSCHPPFSLPLVIMLLMWCVVYVLFGVAFRLIGSYESCQSLSLKVLVSYLATLFWVPLLLVAGNLLCSISSLVISVGYLIAWIRVIGRYSTLAIICTGVIMSVQLYFLYFTVAFAIIN